MDGEIDFVSAVRTVRKVFATSVIRCFCLNDLNKNKMYKIFNENVKICLNSNLW